MQKPLVVTACAVVLAMPHAWAQSERFSGWSLGANLNATTTWTEFTGGGSSAKMSDSAQNLSLQAAYGLTLGHHGVLSFGLTYGLGELKAGSTTAGGRNVEFRLKDLYSVYLEPGYAISPNWLAYAKLGYYGVRAGEESVDGVTASKTFGGLGYGLGVRTMLDRNLYLQIEYTQADYNRKTPDFGTYRPMTATGSIGLGLKF